MKYKEEIDHKQALQQDIAHLKEQQKAYGIPSHIKYKI
jgi:hypothetical protein